MGRVPKSREMLCPAASTATSERKKGENREQARTKEKETIERETQEGGRPREKSREWMKGKSCFFLLGSTSTLPGVIFKVRDFFLRVSRLVFLPRSARARSEKIGEHLRGVAVGLTSTRGPTNRCIFHAPCCLVRRIYAIGLVAYFIPDSRWFDLNQCAGD